MSFVPIHIDASQFAENFNISDRDIKQFTANIISELAAEFAMRWDREANVLKSSRQEYKNSIYVNKVNDLTYEVGLIGFVPNAIENGLDPFDEKHGFERSNKVKSSKEGGWYLTVPFRHASAGALGENPVFQNVMPSQVYSVAKKLSQSEGLNVKNLPGEFRVKNVRPEVVSKSRIFEEYQHKHSIHSGIIKKKDSTGRGTYVSFRRVSNNSDDNSWIHTGIEARNLSSKALDKMDIPAVVDNLANKYVEELWQ